MSKKTWIIGGVAVLAIAGATILGRSLNHANDSKGSTGSNKVTTLKVAHTQNYVPYDFVDEKGESDGYEVAVLKAIDEKLPDYKFEYTGTSDDDLLIGLESGKYDIGTKGAWYTEERAKKFIIPKEPIGASIIGFTVRKEDADKYKNIDDFAKEKGKLVPISPQNAQWNVIKEYNEKHKEKIEANFYQSVQSLLNEKKFSPDVYFLDIELQDGNGLKLAGKIRTRNSKIPIVFITSHEEFMPEAFHVHAYQYLNEKKNAQAVENVLNQLADYFSEQNQIFSFQTYV